MPSRFLNMAFDKRVKKWHGRVQFLKPEERSSPQERGGSGGAGTPAKKQTQTQTPPRPGGAAAPIAPAAIIPPAVKSTDSGPIDDPAVSDLLLITDLYLPD